MREINNIAISLRNISKIYRLHGSQKDQLIDVLGLQRFGIKPKSQSKSFSALSNINLDVPKGHRIGIIGRNGAGKTTLLKLICGNFMPTSGEIEVNGNVQALMSVGLGFHPEYTGRENIEGSLQYNGLTKSEYRKAITGIIDFCELGDFLDQPFKTYSLGMQARLMFATATAVKPDILIVDEVLGAGDAYFVAKSKSRVESLIQSGCTMLLVSHSMQQVLELCDEVIWLDDGKIRMQGESLSVVKAYEEYLHGPVSQIRNKEKLLTASNMSNDSEDSFNSMETAFSHKTIAREFAEDLRSRINFQDPIYIPHELVLNIPQGWSGRKLNYPAPGGVSRWDGIEGLKIVGFDIYTSKGFGNTIMALQPVMFIVTIVVEKEDDYSCRYGLSINDHLGKCITRIFSQEDQFSASEGSTRTVTISLNPCQIGPGEYTVGLSVHPYEALEYLNSVERYDLLSRSFTLKIELPESLAGIEGLAFHSAEWGYYADQS